MSRSTAIEEHRHADRKLRILHVLRAPVGGLFRHVRDLAQEQIARGHLVGIVTDSTTGGEKATEILAELAPSLALGILRLPMRRQPSVLDLGVALKVGAHAQQLGVDIIHGHGAKGGLYARFPRLNAHSFAPLRVYTPHGGSFSMTMRPSLQSFYMFIERLLEPFTDVYLFESTFVAQRFADQIGRTRAVTRIVPNGISESEFARIEPQHDAANFIYVGELRWQKGIDLLIDAMAVLTKHYGPTLRLVLVGSGPDKEKFIQRVATSGLSSQITFIGPMAARDAFRLGRILVLPSQSESFPYIVLEAAGAQLPIIATNVGDIGQVLAPYADELIPPNDLDRLVAAMTAALERTAAEWDTRTANVAAFAATRFTLTNMADAILGAYTDAMELKSPKRSSSEPSLAVL